MIMFYGIDLLYIIVIIYYGYRVNEFRYDRNDITHMFCS